ncbi:AI-2E family transporter [Microbacterium sediminis]|uniref:AI-2E family transporter n=1 Tax=Microbacterium sediminis TaxID=904291 RepID=A0A1B9NIS8_9MICO|nr:AI-2E family transporter [Microbacterium sediminis]OCG76517.1 AI-2E family transporter [Microbacterium sediminis]QBR73879.1 AI-2E family transporter [Microbacterium sediminis]
MSDENRRGGFWDFLRARPVTLPGGETRPAEPGEVPPGLRIATAYAWRFLVIAGAAAVIVWLVITFKLLVIPILVAILITALLYPGFTLMLRLRMPRILAIIVSVVGTLAIVVGLVWLVVWQVSRQAGEVRDRAAQAITDLRTWAIESGLLTEQQISDAFGAVVEFVREQADALLSGALTVGTTVGHLGTGLLLAIFILICLLADGASIWRWTLRLFPRPARAAVDASARNGWQTLINYARTQIIVATIDAVGIGIGALLLGVPLAIPIAVLVFLGAFVPFVGAIVTGAVAVVIALVYNGPWIALAMLAVVLLVQQVESHLLQPLLMGSAVKVHPLAVVLVVAGGSMIGGIAGALFAVPVAAFVNVVAVTLASGSWRTGAPPDADLIWSTVPRTIGRDEPDDDPTEGKRA